MLAAIAAFNDRLAVRCTRAVATMWCAYAFAFLALLGLPQAIHDTVAGGALPMVTWISQAFLQLVLLSIVMVGQSKLSESAEIRASEDHAAIMEELADMREVLDDVREIKAAVSHG
jgi:DNA integrity scanning protein DisA with diadenylate cyclase activity